MNETTPDLDLDAVHQFLAAKNPNEAQLLAKQILGQVDAPEGGTLPPGLQNNPFVGTPEPQQYELMVSEVQDSLNPNRGKLILSEDLTSGIAYLPEGFSIKKLNPKAVSQYIAAGEKEIPLTRVAAFNIDQYAQRTCQFFSPAEGYIEKNGAQLADNYEFDRPHPWSVCSEAEVKKAAQRPNPPCSVEGQQATCPYYNPEPDKLVRAVNLTLNDSTNVIVEVKSTRRGLGTLVYSVYQGAPGQTPDLAFMVSSLEHNTDLNKVLDEELAKLIASYNPTDLEELHLPETQEEKSRYFDYVLEG